MQGEQRPPTPPGGLWQPPTAKEAASGKSNACFWTTSPPSPYWAAELPCSGTEKGAPSAPSSVLMCRGIICDTHGVRYVPCVIPKHLVGAQAALKNAAGMSFSPPAGEGVSTGPPPAIFPRTRGIQLKAMCSLLLVLPGGQGQFLLGLPFYCGAFCAKGGLPLLTAGPADPGPAVGACRLRRRRLMRG